MRWLLVVGTFALAACGGAFSDGDDDDGSGGSGAFVGNGGSFPTGGQGGSTSGGTSGAGGDAGTCTPHTVQVPASADTVIYPKGMECSVWDWSINGGSSIILPIGGVEEGAGRALLRFDLGADLYAKLQTPESSLRLSLTRVPGGADCGTTCPFSPGKIQAFPLRLEWTEGDGGNHTGANWCFGGANETEPWAQAGAAGAQDSGALVGSADVVDGATSASIPLTIPPFSDWADANQGRLSVLLTPTAGVKFFVASRENLDLAHPTLEIGFCTP
jgi:hypothetical protein